MAQRNAQILVLCVILLLATGLVTLFSASAYAHDAHGDIYHFIKRQCAWLCVGAAVAAIVAMLDYRLWRHLCWIIYAAALILLMLCFVRGVGSHINGSWRWVHFGPLTFQPSEIAKLACVLVLAHWFANYEHQSSHFVRGFLLPSFLIALPMLLILREEDMGAALLIGLVAVSMMFIAGGNLLYMAVSALILCGGIYLKASHNVNRSGRMTAFLDLEKHKEDFGLQQYESLKAFASGGLQGVGLGDSREKMHYLPYAHTDFIFPVIGEELGLRVTVPIVLAFLTLTLCGITIATRSRDRFGMLLAFGAVLTVALQAAINIGVTTAGGSNLCICLLFTGILVSVSRSATTSTRASPIRSATPTLQPSVAQASLGKRTSARRVPRNPALKKFSELQ